MSKTSIKKVHENLLDVWTWKNLKPNKHSLSFDVCIMCHICFEGKLVLSLSAKFLNWGDRANSVPDLAASPPGFGVSTMQYSLPTTHQRKEEIITPYMLGLNCLKASVMMNIGLSINDYTCPFDDFCDIGQRSVSTVKYSGTSPLGHFYLRDTSIKGTQNLLTEKCSHNLCICDLYSTSLFRGKGHFFWVPKPRLNLHSGDTQAVKK